MYRVCCDGTRSMLYLKSNTHGLYSIEKNYKSYKLKKHKVTREAKRCAMRIRNMEIKHKHLKKYRFKYQIEKT